MLKRIKESKENQAEIKLQQVPRKITCTHAMEIHNTGELVLKVANFGKTFKIIIIKNAFLVTHLQVTFLF